MPRMLPPLNGRVLLTDDGVLLLIPRALAMTSAGVVKLWEILRSIKASSGLAPPVAASGSHALSPKPTSPWDLSGRSER